MPDHSSPARRRRGPQIFSTLLFVTSLLFAVAAAALWYLDDNETPQEAPIPTVESGVYQLVNVLEGFKAAGIDADYGRTPPTASSDQLPVPGQNLRVGDATVFVFIFNGATPEEAIAQRETAFGKLDLATLALTTPSGNDVSGGEPLQAWQGANVIVVMIGGDAELQAQVQQTVEGFS